MSVTWPTGLPPGTYRFGVFTTASNAFADGVVGPTDVAAFASDQLQSL